MSDTMNPGDRLNPGDSRTSKNGKFTFTFQIDRDLVLTHISGRILWQTGRRWGDYVILQHDGNLVEYYGAEVKWHSGSDGHPGAYLIVQDDGNVVIYQGGGHWFDTGTVEAARRAEADEHVVIDDGDPFCCTVIHDGRLKGRKTVRAKSQVEAASLCSFFAEGLLGPRSMWSRGDGCTVSKGACPN